MDHHPYHDGHWNRPPEGQHWGWQDRERWHRGYDPWFFEHSPNYERWNPIIRAEARELALMLDAGRCAQAMMLLNAELYDLRYDRYAQNELLRQIALAEQYHRLHLDQWDPDQGTWGRIDVTPPPAPLPPDYPPDQPPPPAPEPVPLPPPPAQDDPWMHLEGAVIGTLMDGGDSQAAATRLESDLYLLRGNIDAQNTLLGVIDGDDRKGAGNDLKLGNWNPDTGTYDSVHIAPTEGKPGAGIPVVLFPSVNALPPADAVDTTKSNSETDPWRHQEIAVIAALLDAGDSNSAATQLTADLQALKGDLDSQNTILSQVAASLQKENGAKLVLGAWDANAGTYSSIELLPVGAKPGTGIPVQTYPVADAVNQ